MAFDHDAALGALDQALIGPGRALQVSTILVRMQYGAYEMRVPAYGIGPISNIGQLQGAMDRALATGLIPGISTLWNGTEILTLSLAPQAITVTSGAQSLVLRGLPPTSFADLQRLQELGLRAAEVDTMSGEDRAAWLGALVDHGVTSLTLRQSGSAVFGFAITADQTSLTMGQLRLTLQGSFGDFVQVAGLMSQALMGFEITGQLDLAGFAGLGVQGLRLTDTAGTSLMRVTDMTQSGLELEGRHYGEWLGLRGDGAQVLTGAAGQVASLLTGYGGDDRLIGREGNDGLFGGTGDDTLNGGAGDDLLAGGAGEDTALYTSPGAARVDLRVKLAQDTGHGRDRLSGIENVTSGRGDDWLRGDAGANRLAGAQGADTLAGGAGNDSLFGGTEADRIFGGTGDDRIEGGAGNDRLTGGAGADVFVFAVADLFDLGFDVITDFAAGDRLELAGASTNIYLAGMSPSEVVALFGRMIDGHAALDILPGVGLQLLGVSDLATLRDALIL